MKVAKFGGSSLSSAGQIKKVATIIKNDPEIRAVVVSAPGKREEADTKVTDLLIALFTNHLAGLNVQPAIDSILTRYQLIVEELGLSDGLIDRFERTLRSYLNNIKDDARLLDALKSAGEDFNAQVVSDYLVSLGLKAAYLSPKDAGIVVTDEPSNAQLLPESYDYLKQLIGSETLYVIPGFFGYSKKGDIVTFPRGGSDITGAIVARGLEADVYENFTDQSYIFSAHPGHVRNPHAINAITYREMRELSYSGFSIFHDEALEPLYQVKIPVQIKNTNEPEIDGTRIVAERSDVNDYPVIGISSDEGFTSITLRQYLLNREVGYTRRLLQIFEDHNISIEHIPSGIDNISIIIRSHRLKENELQQIVQEIQDKLNPEWVQIEEDLAMMVIVGEGMREVTGLANKATSALAENNINIRMINQGASEISMIFAIAMKDQKKALAGLYEKYFNA